MNPLLSFHQFLNKFVTLSEEEFNMMIKPHIRLRQFCKKEIITPAGQVEHYFNFVLNGLVRRYYRRGSEEVNIQIAAERHIIQAYESFLSGAPTEQVVEAIEPTHLLSISRHDLDKIYSYNAKMERMGRLLLTFTLILKERWQMQLVKLSPRERFLLFVQNQPKLLQRVPQKQLASLLNIKPETFSRFKHMLKDRRVGSECSVVSTE